jgi:putative tricarboxylic transport membrane protein
MLTILKRSLPVATLRSLISAAATIGLFVGSPALALENVKILAPAGPGGGWDQTARALQASMQKHDVVKKVTVDNKGGAGGTIGLAQFVSSSKGDPNALMIGGTTMLGAIHANNRPSTCPRSHRSRA